MSETPIRPPLGQPVSMAGHFDVPVVALSFRASRDQVFKSFPPITNLADEWKA